MNENVVRIGDVHNCPKHGENTVISGQLSMLDTQPIACIGDQCACGGVITEGTQMLTINGKPVAYTGCKTSCGGVVIGSSNITV